MSIAKKRHKTWVACKAYDEVLAVKNLNKQPKDKGRIDWQTGKKIDPYKPYKPEKRWKRK
jgi:hypothetical protein